MEDFGIKGPDKLYSEAKVKDPNFNSESVFLEKVFKLSHHNFEGVRGAR